MFTSEIVSLLYTWKLIFFILGSFLTASGALIFSQYCPGECKKYDTAVEYANAEVDFFTANHSILVRRLRKRFHDLAPRYRTYLHVDEINGRIRALHQSSMSRYEKREAVLFLMDQFWHTLDPSFPGKRAICYLLFGSGLFLIYAPTLALILQLLSLPFL